MNATTNADHDNFINLDEISRIYDMGVNQVKALEKVSINIPKSQLVVILGPSGSGKTTLLNLIGAIDNPSTGKIIALGRDLTKLSRTKLAQFRRDHIGFIFQFFNLIPSLTALENVCYALQLQGKKDSTQKALKSLEDVGLGQRYDHFPGELSGGEQQRVAIARAIAKEPEILLADEPTGELDFETGIKILDLLYSTAKKGHTVIIVTHNAEIARMGDRVIRLRSGKVILDQINGEPVVPSALRW